MSNEINVIPTIENVDYDRIYKFNVNPNFGLFNANRDLNKSHVKKVKRGILEGKYKAKYIAPIRVDIRTMKISDGQHRDKAFKEAWEMGSTEIMRVIFEDLPEDEREKLDVVAEINSTQSNWGQSAYEKRMIVEGNESMIDLEDFGKSHALCQKRNKKGEVTGFYSRYVYAIVLGRNVSKEIREGKLKVKDSDIDFAEQIHYELERLIKALGYEMNSWFESFANAWYAVRKDRVYCEEIEKIGFDVIVDNIKSKFDGWQVGTSRIEWEQRFRTAIYEIKRENC